MDSSKVYRTSHHSNWVNRAQAHRAAATAEFYPFSCKDWPRELSSTARIQVPPWKRILDLACILLALPSLLPLLLLIAIIIKFASRGPVFFRQERVGFLGRRFTLFKFRTMATSADTAMRQEQCNRLIPFGRLLRMAGLDELAQIFNIIRGEMSLVGPRPCPPSEYEQYLPWQRERFNTLPGLTGLWQVNGENRTTFEEMIRLDVDYARNKSLGMDLAIMLKSLPAVSRQNPARPVANS